MGVGAAGGPDGGVGGALGSTGAVGAGLTASGEGLGGPTEVQAAIINISEAKAICRITRL